MHSNQEALSSTTMTNSTAVHGSSDLSTSSLTHLLSVSTTVLRQAIDLLDNYLTSDEQLSIHSKYLPGSTIGTVCSTSYALSLLTTTTGKHLRHARDHFVLLADCISQTPPHSFSYDTRSRNTPMETSRSAAREALSEAIRQLEEVVPRANSNESMTLNAVTPHLQSFETTFGREVNVFTQQSSTSIDLA